MVFLYFHVLSLLRVDIISVSNVIISKQVLFKDQNASHILFLCVRKCAPLIATSLMGLALSDHGVESL